MEKKIIDTMERIKNSILATRVYSEDELVQLNLDDIELDIMRLESLLDIDGMTKQISCSPYTRV